ncbi:WRKY19, partial [Symbiodinium microadriaticum]
MGRQQYFCVEPTPEGPCGEKAVRNGRCREHGGKRQRCLHPTPDGPCQKLVVNGGETKACRKHGNRRHCLHPTPNGPCQRFVQGGGEVRACAAHGGGPRCKSEACVGLTSPPSAKYKSPEGLLCWGCFTAKYPDRAKLKVRKEHLLLAELQRRLPWLGEKAEQMIWDCPLPGGCTLKRPDMLFRFEDRFVQVEVDEEGHEDLSCADEDSRLELIAADVGLP